MKMPIARAVLSALFFLFILPVQAEPIQVTLATATRGGGFTLFGDVAAAAINAADGSISVSTHNTKGSVENIGLLEEGKFDIGLVQGVAAYEAFTGIGRQPADLKVIAAIYSSPGMFAVRGDSSARSVGDLIGKPIAWGTRTSGLTLMAKYVMDGLGLKRDADFEPHFLEKAGDGPGMVREGRVAALWGAGIGWPGFTKVMASGGRLMGFSADEIKAVTAKYSFLKSMTVPAGAYEGQREPVNTVGVWSYILARPDLPDDTGYRLAKALHMGQSAMVSRLDQARETTPANTRGAADADKIHPGVERYLRDLGL
ncbi:MAG: TAXI family TRAP transporter solute-binding subunit [Filomicrobium sp.]|nr:TAXI family TRAP transporter solute-binding subunit [Filomicrobium sp.]